MHPSPNGPVRSLAVQEVGMPGTDIAAPTGATPPIMVVGACAGTRMPAIFACVDIDCVVGFASLTGSVNDILLSSGNQKLRDNSPEEPSSAAAP